MTCEYIETGECTLMAVWDPPIVRESIKHYMIYINGTFLRNTSDHDNRITYSSSACTCLTTNISVCAVNDCGLVGPKAQSAVICIDDHDTSTIATSPTPTTNNADSNNLR